MRWLLGLLLLGLLGLAEAGVGLQRLDAFLAGLNSLQARFQQSVLDVERGRAGSYTGTFYLSRPGRFRWDYDEPAPQFIVADGERVWIIDRDLEQVSFRDQARALNGTPALLLATDARVEEHFETIDIGSSQGMDWVELIPRDEESQFIRILLAFAGDQLRRMELNDKFGQVTRFQFHDIERNAALDETLFQYRPPPGFDVFGQ